MTSTTVQEALHRNGVIIERARREGRSLDAIERNIIAAGRNLAADKCVIRHRANAMEMEGERDWQQVLAPIRVVTEFAYYDPMFIPAAPMYRVLKSNHPGLPVGSDICVEQLLAAGQEIPKTPKS